MRKITLLLATTLVVLAAGIALAEKALNLPALDFRQGKQGWTAWTGRTSFHVMLDAGTTAYFLLAK